MAKKGHHDNMSIKSFAFEVLRMFVENEKKIKFNVQNDMCSVL